MHENDYFDVFRIELFVDFAKLFFVNFLSAVHIEHAQEVEILSVIFLDYLLNPNDVLFLSCAEW